MYCHRCGTKIEEKVNFCPNCGARLEYEQEETIKEENSANVEDTKIPLTGTFNVKPWSTWAYALLIILAILAPLIGLIVGLYNRKTIGKESQSKTLIYTSVIAWIVFIVLQVLAR